MDRYESVRYYNNLTCFLFNILPGYFHPWLYRCLLKFIDPAKLYEKMEEYIEVEQKAWTKFVFTIDYGMNKSRFDFLLNNIQFSEGGLLDQTAYDNIKSRDRRLLRPFINKTKQEIEQLLKG